MITTIPKRVRAEGGGGCFVAGTKVSTPNGPVSIENLAVGDAVYAFDISALEPGEVSYPGSVVVRKVTAVFKHSWDEVGETSLPLTITHEEGTLRTTGNHYILTSSRKSKFADADLGFVRADELQVGDILYTRYGQPSKVKARRKGAKYDFVYNLEVERNHTYIADKVRVHNGGGGKKSRDPVQASDTVRSNQIAKVLLNPTEGPSGGLWDVFINGGYGSAGDTLENRSKSVYLGGTQVINSDGQFEFSNISVQQRVGLPDQTIIEGFSTTESEFVTGLPVTIRKYNTQYKGEKETVALLPATGNTLYDLWFVKAAGTSYMWSGTAWVPTTGLGSVAPSTSSGVVSAPLDANIDAVRITIGFPNGLQVLDQKTGDTSGSSVQLRFSRRLSGGSWVQISTPIIKEMSSGEFLWTTEIHRPAGLGTWEFRVERLSNDTTSNLTRDDTVLKSYTRIQETKYNDDGSVLFEPTYDNRALVAIQLGADSTNGQVPAIALDMAGVLVYVPNNYTTRLYNKDWNVTREADYSTLGWGGTFKSTVEWTDNPAWLLYELMTNDRFGLGNNEEDGGSFRIDPAMIDVSSFYNAARYCDDLVDDMLGEDTSEPRFTFNGQLMVREDAWKTLQTFASAFNSKLYIHGGMIRIGVDAPATFTKIFNNTNVVGGAFSYSYSDATSRYSQCNVTFNDPKDNFLPKVVSVTDQDGLNRYGLQTTNLLAYGCAKESQARRAAKWAVYTSLNTTAVISFGVSIRHADLEPNEVFKALDYNFAQAYQEGAIISASGTTIVLDQPFVRTAGGVWTIDLIGSDGASIETRTVTNGVGTHTTLTLNAATTALPGSPWVITGSGLDQVKPMLFRVVELTEGEGGTWNVTGIQYDPNKYAFIETGEPIPPTIYFQQPNLTSLSAPTNLIIKTASTLNPDGIVFRRFEVSWTPPADGTAVSYTIQYRKDGGFLTTIQTSLPYALIQADIDGDYEFYVNARNAAGVTSPTLSGTYELTTVFVDGSEQSPPNGLGEVTTGGAIFQGQDLNVKWLNPEYNGVLRHFEVKVTTVVKAPTELDPNGTRTDVLRTEIVPNLGSGQIHNYSYTFTYNVADTNNLPARTVTLEVRGVDMNNKYTTAATRTFTNPPPGIPSDLTLRAAFNNNRLSYRLPTDNDFVGVIVWSSLDPNFVPSEDNVLREGTDTLVVHSGVDPSTTYYYRVAAYDTFGKDYTGQSLIMSSVLQVVSANTDFDTNKLPNSSFELVQARLAPGLAGIGNAIHRPLNWLAMDGDGSIGIEYTMNTGRNSANSVGIKALDGGTGQFGIRTFPEDNGGATGGYQLNKFYVISIWARKGAGGSDWTGIDCVFTDDFQPVKEVLLNPVLSTSWQRYAWKVKWLFTIASNGRADFKVIKADGTDGTVVTNDEIRFDDAQIELGDVLTAHSEKVGELGPNSITETLIAPDSITTPKVVALNIIGSHIQSNTFETRHFQADTIIADFIDVNNLAAISADLGEINTGYIHDLGGGIVISSGGYTQADDWPVSPTASGFQLNNSGLKLGRKPIAQGGTVDQFLLLTNTGAFYSPYLSMDSGGAYFSGDLAAAGGTFSGDLSAASGTFAGDISAATGHFTGVVDIQDAQVTTLKIAGRAVTFPVSAYSPGGPGIPSYSATAYMWVPPDAMGARPFVVPAGITSINITSIGGGGGGGGFWGGGDDHPGGGGGCGGVNTTTITVTPGESLYLVVGEGGPAAGFAFESTIFCQGNSTRNGNRGGSTFLVRRYSPDTRLAEATGGYGGNGAWDDNAAPIDADHTNGSGNNGTPGSFAHAPGEPVPPSNGTDSNRRSYYAIQGATNGSGYGTGGHGNHHDIGGIALQCPTNGTDGRMTISWTGGSVSYNPTPITDETAVIALISASVAVPRGGYGQYLSVHKPSDPPGYFADVRMESVAGGTVPALFYQQLISEPGTWHFQVRSSDTAQGARAFISALMTVR